MKTSEAGLSGFLSDVQDSKDQQFSVAVMLQASNDLVGAHIDLINLDIIHSSVVGQSLVDYSRVRYTASSPFAAWQNGVQFGDPQSSFPSEITIDAFSNRASNPYQISDTSAFSIGQLTFDYSGLGLRIGDEITLDVTGVDSGLGSRSTSVAVSRPAPIVLASTDSVPLSTLVNVDFGSAGSHTHVITRAAIIPEPNTRLLFFAGTALIAILPSRRQRV